MNIIVHWQLLVVEWFIFDTCIINLVRFIVSKPAFKIGVNLVGSFNLMSTVIAVSASSSSVFIPRAISRFLAVNVSVTTGACRFLSKPVTNCHYLISIFQFANDMLSCPWGGALKLLVFLLPCKTIILIQIKIWSPTKLLSPKQILIL